MYLFFLSKHENNPIIGPITWITADVGGAIWRICLKFPKIRTYSSSRSSKVIDLGVNRKPMHDFLLVTNSNFGRNCCRFRDIDAKN